MAAWYRVLYSFQTEPKQVSTGVLGPGNISNEGVVKDLEVSERWD